MSKNLEKVIQRAISDAAFRRQLQSNPEAAVRGFNLTQDEVAALRSGDAGKLTSFGVDQRMSKTFAFSATTDGATRAVAGGDLGVSQTGALSDRDLRLTADPATGAAASGAALDPGQTSGETRLSGSAVTGSAGGSAAFDPGFTSSSDTVIGDPMQSNASSVLRDPENPANARGYIGGEAASAATQSNIGDPDNPVFARGYTGGGGAAPTFDALEDQSIGNASSRSADVPGGGATASTIGDPDNPAFARGYTGGGAAPTSDALENQSHDFAASRSADIAGGGTAAPIPGSPEEFAFRDQGATASTIGDPDNPAFARGYTGGGGAAPTSDALEDQSHSIAAKSSDAFMTPGEVSQYSTTDPNWSSDQAEDLSHTFNPDGSTALPDDGGTIAQHHEPDVPS